MSPLRVNDSAKNEKSKEKRPEPTRTELRLLMFYSTLTDSSPLPSSPPSLSHLNAASDSTLIAQIPQNN